MSFSCTFTFTNVYNESRPNLGCAIEQSSHLVFVKRLSDFALVLEDGRTIGDNLVVAAHLAYSVLGLGVLAPKSADARRVA